MQLVRSLIFNIFLYVGLILIFILAIPTLILPSKFTIFFGRLSETVINLPPAKWSDRIPAIILAVMIVVLGVQPNWVVRWTETEANSMSMSKTTVSQVVNKSAISTPSQFHGS